MRESRSGLWGSAQVTNRSTWRNWGIGMLGGGFCAVPGFDGSSWLSYGSVG
jgi:hypothetical protein